MPPNPSPGLTDKYPDLVVHQELETDTEPAKALVDAAAKARLLVIGSRGRGGFSRLVLGSTAHAVLLNVPCPTIVTRLEKVKHEDYANAQRPGPSGLSLTLEPAGPEGRCSGGRPLRLRRAFLVARVSAERTARRVGAVLVEGQRTPAPASGGALQAPAPGGAQAERGAARPQVRFSCWTAHDAVNRRWLDYELDVGKLIDFPVMTDVREPLTVAFLRAKRQADGLRPEAGEARDGDPARGVPGRRARLRARLRRRRTRGDPDQGQQIRRTGTGAWTCPQTPADRFRRRRHPGRTADGVQAGAPRTGRTDRPARTPPLPRWRRRSPG